MQTLHEQKKWATPLFHNGANRRTGPAALSIAVWGGPHNLTGPL